MNKRKTARVAAFIGSLGASAALIASAVGTTGAYFTDSKDGSLSGTSGHIKVDVSGQNLAFSGLMPGEYQTKTVAFSTNSTGNSDVWMVFNQTDDNYQKLTGAKGSPSAPDGGLGGYGHFAVLDAAGNTIFSSWNLQNDTGQVSGCADADGHGGNARRDDYDYSSQTLCGIPRAIKIRSNIPTGDYAFKVEFGITPKAKSGHDAPWAGTVPFKVVATQPGVNPTGNFINNADKY